MDCRSLLLPAFLAAATAWAQSATDPGKTARCATRLSVAFLGQTPTSAMLAQANPQSQIDTLMKDPAFVERFASFINATFNSAPAPMPEQDAAYWLTKVILTTNQPWKQLFIGPYRVDPPDPTAGGDPVVVSDPNGLGYFRSMPWEIEYEGNEEAGYKLRTAYRMMNNIIGLHLVPATTAPGVDRTATGRQAAQCAGCHYNSVFALDKIARVLTRRNGTGQSTTFTPPDPTQVPQTVLGGSVSSDSDVVHTLVNSASYSFRACRLAFLYLYGRNEYTCDGPLFDSCVSAFNQSGMIQTALKTVAADASYCQ